MSILRKFSNVIFFIICIITNLAAADQKNVKPLQVSHFKGWDYLVKRLIEVGVHESDVRAVYQSPMMPKFTFIPFSVAPREHKSIYSSFLNPKMMVFGKKFLHAYAYEFNRVEKVLHVPREYVTAILLVESQLGEYTGKDIIIYRLSRLASVAEPENIQKNFNRLRKDDSDVTLKEVEGRAKYLEKTFLPEIPALIKIGKRNNVNVLKVRGSIAGAFGLPQFLPTAFLRYGFDGNKDGVVSLFNEIDAIWSAANYLAHFGFVEELDDEEKRKILWRYNHSDAYIDTVMEIARLLSIN